MMQRFDFTLAFSFAVTINESRRDFWQVWRLPAGQDRNHIHFAGLLQRACDPISRDGSALQE
jgi:hypothetical protein